VPAMTGLASAHASAVWLPCNETGTYVDLAHPDQPHTFTLPRYPEISNFMLEESKSKQQTLESRLIHWIASHPRILGAFILVPSWTLVYSEYARVISEAQKDGESIKLPGSGCFACVAFGTIGLAVLLGGRPLTDLIKQNNRWSLLLGAVAAALAFSADIWLRHQLASLGFP